MSSAGNCYDNAVMESFYHTLKVEAIYGSSYKTRMGAQLALFDYIEVFTIANAFILP
ncbi:MAG: IS3 family transposase [Tatlockia sp.]|nr:IS3 family transposase [Tatlockia sp.]MBA3978039.1 IS3 family transposase [Nitrosopumilus sp.]